MPSGSKETNTPEEASYSITFGGHSKKKEVDLIEIEGGVMNGFEIKRKEGKRVCAPTQFASAYPDAGFKCITPSELTEFLM